MPQVTRQWTVDAVHAIPDDGKRYEVIDGELFVTPAPALRHQAAVGELYALLHGYLLRERVGHAYVAPVDVIFSPVRLVQPDVLVIPRIEGRSFEEVVESGMLLLSVEVVSPSSARTDRVRKRTLHREQHVPEYWIVDLDARTFERVTPADTRAGVRPRRSPGILRGRRRRSSSTSRRISPRSSIASRPALPVVVT